MAEQSASPYIVAIGASSGGMDALFDFFDNTLPDGVSYIVTTHLHPHHRSQLARLIQEHSTIKVMEAKDRDIILSNTVYVMPENRTMKISRGRLILYRRDLNIKLNYAIDLFFCSLAEDNYFKKIAIILSGLGNDGTAGIKLLAARGAFIMAQAPASATESSMPMSIIDAGYAHEILSPAAMPQAIIEYISQQKID